MKAPQDTAVQPWKARPSLIPDTIWQKRKRIRPWLRRRPWDFLILALVALDALLIASSLVSAYTIRLGLLQYQAPYDPAVYHKLVLISVPLWLLIFAISGLYRRDLLLGGVEEYKQIIKACSAGIIAVIVVSFLWRDFAMVSRGWVLISWTLSTFLLLLGRFLVRRIAYALRRRGYLTDRTLIIGANGQGQALAQQWSEAAGSGMKVLGFLDDFAPPETPVLNGLKVLGRPRELNEIAHALDITEVVVVPTAIAWESFEEVIAEANEVNGYTLRLSPGFYELMSTGIVVTNKSFVPLYTVNRDRLVGTDAALKKILDLGVGSVLFLLTLPLNLAIAFLLKWEARDLPVLIPHRTLAQGGGTFTMYKYRSATPVPKSSPPHRATVSRLERWLQATGMDKLPQLVHVLLGQMSLVGPRPQVLGQTQWDGKMARQMQTLKPGVTGPWVVSSYWISEDETRNDLYYLRNWTVWLDLQILAQTLLHFLSARGRVRSERGARQQRRETSEIGALHR